MELAVSLLVAFLLPWSIASLVHVVDTLDALVCFCAFTVCIAVCYAAPLIYFCDTVQEAQHSETNFRLSLKQMYDGDRLSRKETSILPKACKAMMHNGLDSSLQDSLNN